MSCGRPWTDVEDDDAPLPAFGVAVLVDGEDWEQAVVAWRSRLTGAGWEWRWEGDDTDRLDGLRWWLAIPPVTPLPPPPEPAATKKAAKKKAKKRRRA